MHIVDVKFIILNVMITIYFICSKLSYILVTENMREVKL